MELALIPPGAFLMGSPPDEAGRLEHEHPHEVEITRAFGLGVNPVTVGQFQALAQATGYRQTRWQNPGFPQADTHPVVNVSWYHARKFCAWLTQTDPGREYRLPTEAEWEYACRGGAPESYPFHVGQPLHCLSSTQANFDGTYPYGGAAKGPALRRTTPVGSYPPNGWGLYDMHGNVFEWCADWYRDDYYPQSPRQDPPGPPGGSLRVVRGGWQLGLPRPVLPVGGPPRERPDVPVRQPGLSRRPGFVRRVAGGLREAAFSPGWAPACPAGDRPRGGPRRFSSRGVHPPRTSRNTRPCTSRLCSSLLDRLARPPEAVVPPTVQQQAFKAFEKMCRRRRVTLPPDLRLAGYRLLGIELAINS
jgi:hypothetical protein